MSTCIRDCQYVDFLGSTGTPSETTQATRTPGARYRANLVSTRITVDFGTSPVIDPVVQRHLTLQNYATSNCRSFLLFVWCAPKPCRQHLLKAPPVATLAKMGADRPCSLCCPTVGRSMTAVFGSFGKAGEDCRYVWNLGRQGKRRKTN